jgi:putative hydrolase of the HAD superfamily
MAAASCKVISFDLDGTLVDENFDLYLWFEELPRLYSQQRGIGLEEAKKILRAEYDRVGAQRREWYDLCFWISRHRLALDPQKVILDLSHKIAVYPDVIPVLGNLKRQGRRMVVFSNTPKMFLDIKKKVDGIDGYFERTVSVYSDYGEIKTQGGAFCRLARELGVKPGDILHVGDSFKADYEPALREGCKAVLLERPGAKLAGSKAGLGVRKICDLYGLLDLL